MTTKTKPAAKKKQAARFDKAPTDSIPKEEIRPTPAAPMSTNPDIPLDQDQSANEFEAAEEEQHAKGKEKKEKTENLRSGVVKPLLEKGQRYFETSDGRFLVGPQDAGSIKDPATGMEVNPWREPSKRLNH